MFPGFEASAWDWYNITSMGWFGFIWVWVVLGLAGLGFLGCRLGFCAGYGVFLGLRLYVG